jgi:class 3 adenylate cyclase
MFRIFHTLNCKSYRISVSVIAFLMTVAHAVNVYGQEKPSVYIQNLIEQYNNAKNDSLKIQLLTKLGSFYLNFLDEKELADSIGEAAIEIADKSSRPQLQFLALTRYIQTNDLDIFPEKALKYARKTMELAKQTRNPYDEWRALRNMDSVYFSNHLYSEAYEYSIREFTVAIQLKNDSIKVESLLDMGLCLEWKNEKLEALKTYIKAMDLAGRLNQPALLKKCYHALSNFYSLAKLLNKAIDFNDSVEIIIRKSVPVDSLALMWLQYDRLTIDINNDNNRLIDKDIQYVLDYAMRHGAKRLKRFEFALYRTHLLKANSIDQLYDLYNLKYPAEFRNLETSEPATYSKLKAYFTEKENKIDSANYYFIKADYLIRYQNSYMRSQFYYRYAQFLIRHGRKIEAIEKLKKSYDLAQQAKYLDNMLNASELMDSLYSELGDFKNAYICSLRNKKLANNLFEWSKKEQLFRTQIEHDDQQREMATAIAKEKTDKEIRQKKAQRNMMAAGLGFLVILSFTIYRNYRNQKRSNRLLDAAKKQSDNLLLNILPFETAEELKLTGTAKAKRFDEVTVMFTDFKGFTMLSERMGAEDLVKLVDFYFSEFDKIIARHNIEKIKIIGDSYMCAGGLPIVNTTNAFDVVSAALEIQEFISVQKDERNARGDIFFEVRIGINSGPVVAGIVGLNKFAYDIWGDTVNIASRMESSGEIGKVNVSGFTYGLIKDHFTCIHRGKVEAKNKGMVDMYFVNKK